MGAASQDLSWARSSKAVPDMTCETRLGSEGWGAFISLGPCYQYPRRAEGIGNSLAMGV